MFFPLSFATVQATILDFRVIVDLGVSVRKLMLSIVLVLVRCPIAYLCGIAYFKREYVSYPKRTIVIFSITCSMIQCHWKRVLNGISGPAAY